jgi:undecaprenyl-diphosphatase
LSIIDTILNGIDNFDVAVVQAVNAMAGKFPVFDLIVLRVFRLDSVRHLPLVGALIWAWYSDPGDGSRRRHVFDGVAGYMISIIVTRVVQDLLPHRPRPALAGTFHFEMPVGGFTNDWSSFPSDTAAQGFALVVGLWMISRNLGIAALLWATFVVCFPRLYGGFHYPSDLIAGGLAGALTTWFVSKRLWGLNAVERRFVWAEQEYRPWFYIFGFFILFQIMAHLEDFKELLETTKKIVLILIHG